MSDEVVVVTDAVAAEAKKWTGLSDQMEPIKNAVDGLDLSASAFYIGLLDGLNFAIYSNSYNDFQQLMLTALGGAVTEFDQLGGGLDKIAKAYDEADKVISLNLDEIWKA